MQYSENLLKHRIAILNPALKSVDLCDVLLSLHASTIWSLAAVDVNHCQQGFLATPSSRKFAYLNSMAQFSDISVRCVG